MKILGAMSDEDRARPVEVVSSCSSEALPVLDIVTDESHGILRIEVV